MHKPYERLSRDLREELRRLTAEALSAPSPAYMVRLWLCGRLGTQRRIELSRIDRLQERARKVMAKADSALDTVIMADREVYYLDELTEIGALCGLLVAKLEECRAGWNLGR